MSRIAWKVISRKARKSCYAEGKYHLGYPIGAKVKAVDGSMGIICSKRKQDAEEFAKPMKLTVIKVRGVGKGFSPRIMSCSFSSHGITSVCEMIAKHGLKVFYKSEFPEAYAQSLGVSDAFKRSIICYPAVEVLE